MNILNLLKNKGIVDKSIDVIADIVPGGNIIKNIGKMLLNDENAPPEKIAKAIEEAKPQDIEIIKLEIQKLHNEASKEIEKTKQKIEDTKQQEFTTRQETFKFILGISKRYILVYSIFLYIVLACGIFYGIHYQDEAIEHSCIYLAIIYATAQAALVYQPMYKIVDSLADLMVKIIKAPGKMLKD